MRTSRREFLGHSLSVGVALSAGRVVARPPRAGKKILILGGTGFLGPACTEAALARGHTVTLFNRSRTEERRQRAGRPSQVPDGVEVLFGNRDPNKTADSDDSAQAGDTPMPDSPKGLSTLEGRSWDAVIDTSGYWPRMVSASASLLSPRVSQYVFISSISVYRNNDRPGQDESGELATMADPTVEDFGADFSNYGPGKALCEAAAEAAMPGRVTNIRPGFIVGQRDTSSRFCYWPVRISRGGPTVVPGAPEDPIQIIDVRDLAVWMVHCIEQNLTGVINATGPAEPHRMDAFVEAIKAGVGGDSAFTWVAPDFLERQGLNPQGFPLWIPPSGETAGFHRVNVARAIAAGLTFRPLSDTAKATLEWYQGLPADLQTRMTPPMDPARELAAIEAWKARPGGG